MNICKLKSFKDKAINGGVESSLIKGDTTGTTVFGGGKNLNNVEKLLTDAGFSKE